MKYLWSVNNLIFVEEFHPDNPLYYMVLPQNDCSKISNWTSNFEYQKSNKINGIITLENESDIFDLN